MANGFEFEGRVTNVTTDQYGTKLDLLDESGQYPDHVSVEVGAKSRLHGEAASLQKGQMVAVKGKLGGKYNDKYQKVFTRLRVFEMQVRSAATIADKARDAFGMSGPGSDDWGGIR